MLQPHRVNLKSMWTTNNRTWFSLAEATFQQYNITNSKMKFNLVLPALSEETLLRMKAIVNMLDQQADPYAALQACLLEVYAPNEWECAARLCHMRELGDLKPSQIMDSMLALLLEGEAPGLLFKSLFLARLPGDMRGHMQAQVMRLNSQELAHLADTIWQSRNAARSKVLWLSWHVPSCHLIGGPSRGGRVLGGCTQLPQEAAAQQKDLQADSSTQGRLTV